MNDDIYRYYGHLSAEADARRDQHRAEATEAFNALKDAVRAALDLIQGPRPARMPWHALMALGYWTRSVEACQGTYLLMERGMELSAWAALRTGYECLFSSAAVLAKPEVLQRMENQHQSDRLKQANALLRSCTDELSPHVLDFLRRSVNEEQAKNKAKEPPGYSAHDAATDAGLISMYDMIYRGASMAGAHATARSLDQVLTPHEDGSITLELVPRMERADFILKVTRRCVLIGIERFTPFFHAPAPGDLASPRRHQT